MKINLTQQALFPYRLYDYLKIMKNLFSKRYPLKISESNISCIPFLIISAGRSGTTLLRAIITKHSKLSVPPESQFLHSAVRKYLAYNFLEWDELVKIIIGELESKEIFKYWNINLAPVYHKLTRIDSQKRSLAKIIDEIYLHFISSYNPKAKIWGDKSPIHTYYLNWIEKIFFKVRYINLIRDGRDAVKSMVKRDYIYNTIPKACARWNQSINITKKLRKKKDKKQYLEIYYENLVGDPKTEILKICDFLNVKFEVEMLHPEKDVEKLGDTNLPHHKNTKKPIDTSSIGIWKQVFNDKQQKNIEKLLYKNLHYLDYI